jgi:transcriptional/translational regulatory protein YebC/TACO1
LGTQGSAAHNFKQIGVIRIDINEIKDDKIFELAIDAGADECFSLENFHEIHCGFEDIYSIKKKIESHVENFISTDIEWIPLNKVYSEGENKEYIKKLIELLDDDDDVQRVYSNFGEKN